MTPSFMEERYFKAALVRLQETALVLWSSEDNPCA
jgi:hypothetical protein